VNLHIPDMVLVYLLPLVIIWGGYIVKRKREERRNLERHNKNISERVREPTTLHPVINHNRCMGCGACANACPEYGVLGIIGGKSHLLIPSKCIGHGACKIACPQNAITLVFGTKERGVDIPSVNPNFETNIPGIFIAGELGGMGLIRNAVEQGKQAIESISRMKEIGESGMLDVVIVGAGPAGFSASLAAKEKNLRYVTLEQEKLGGTVFHYPRGKVVMTSPVIMPMVGKVDIRETTKEELMNFWRDVEKKSRVEIRYGEKVEKVTKEDGCFEVTSLKGIYRSKSVLLSIGLRGTPRKLNVPGEESPRVVYSLVDPEQYRGQEVLVVGGGDSALEAAMSVAREEGASVTLSYRSEAFTRAKEKNRRIVKEMEEEGTLKVLFKSVVKEICAGFVLLEQGKEIIQLGNDVVIVCAGGILPTGFLKEMGIWVETKYGTP